MTIYDDHTPFLRAGIPAVDLIDFSYRYADGLKDTIDKLSLASLDAVGETVFALVSELRAGLGRRGRASCPSAASTAAKAATTAGSNCVPAQRRSSASASAALRRAR